MSITSVSNGYSMNLLSLMSGETDESGSSSQTTTKSSASSRASSAYSGGIMSSQGQKALSQALAAMKAAGYDSISFSDVEEYRQKQEELFSAEVRKDLLDLGVDKDIDFKLVANTDGTVSVVTKHADKEKIEKYLKDNPKMVERFQNLQALSNLKRAADNAPSDKVQFVKDVRKQLQMQAVEAFFAATENSGSSFASQIASFDSDGGQASYLTGLNYTV